jgi:UDP:flavonoid glycosyltransferase YjiC (YdhE family)
MHITFFTAGSTGDIQPCILLGKGLRRAGLDVLLAAPENFAGLIRGHDLSFHPLRGDVQQIMAGETGRKFMGTASANPIRTMLAMRKMIGPLANQMAEDALEACRGADALISLAVFAPFGKSIAEIQGIPLINLEPTPLLPTGDFPAPGWPVQRSLGRLLNRASGFAMLQMIWQWYGYAVNEFRKRYGLPPLSSSSFERTLASVPLLGAYSPSVIPHPPDWSDQVHITGYWFEELQFDWRPSPELEAFLNQGRPPVYVGFGSMGGDRPERIAEIVLQALEQSGQRGLLLTGWGGMDLMTVPENVFVLKAAPHRWLFPRMAAVVHHGGAGTTAEGLRAGVPTVIVPFIVDQPFWGKRIQGLGAGPAPIPAKKLNADQLAAAIQAATTDVAMSERAAALGKAIRSEDGIGNAVQVVQQLLGAKP